MADYIIIGLLVLFCFFTIRREVKEYKKGIRCECINDCKNCKIQCRTNEKYYGIQKKKG